jgi:hypothetical protein
MLGFGIAMGSQSQGLRWACLIVMCISCIDPSEGILKKGTDVRGIVADADRRMKTRTLDSVSKAADLYREALLMNPDDPELQLKTADAMNAVMRIKTNANTILIDGSLDTPENKAFWAKHGEEARIPPSCSSVENDRSEAWSPHTVFIAGLRFSQIGISEASGQCTNSRRFAFMIYRFCRRIDRKWRHAVYTDSFMFLTSSKGILSQASKKACSSAQTWKAHKATSALEHVPPLRPPA